MTLHRLLPLFALALNLLLLGSAAAAERKTPRVVLFASLVSALAVWNLGVLGLRWTDDPAPALLWERFLHLGVIPIPALFYHYVLVFLEVPRRRPSLVVGYLACGVFLAVSPTPIFMPGVSQTAWGFAPAAGPLYGPFFVYFQAYLVMGLVWLLRACRSSESRFRRRRTFIVIFGVAVSLLGGAVDFVRFIFGWERLYPVGIPGNAIFALALGVAIVRYRLMDLGLLAKRLVLYALTAVALAPIVLFGLYALDALTPDAWTPEGRLGADVRYPFVLLLTLAAALPVLRKLEAGLERVMFQRQHGVRDALVALSKEMATVLDIGRLGRLLTEGLVRRVPVVQASLYLYEPTSQSFLETTRAVSDAADPTAGQVAVDGRIGLWLRVMEKTLVVADATDFQPSADVRMRVAELEAARVALLVPLFVDGELAGILAVGEKPSGEIFGSGEIGLLETLAGQAAIALKNARLYEDLRAQMDELRRTQEQLLQSAKLAAIGELAASVAHEINNPLMTILCTSEILLEQTASQSDVHPRLRRIEAEAERAGKIVGNLLNFARRREARRDPVAVPELIERSLDVLQVKFACSRVDVTTAFDAGLPKIAGDFDQLSQVFINLIGNALDAMPDGGRLAIGAASGDDDGRPTLTVRVADTGIGMDRAQLARIFEPFYTTKPEGRGTGLGLSVSLGIVNRHGGTIHAESEPGRGTTVVVTLPLAAPAPVGAVGRAPARENRR